MSANGNQVPLAPNQRGHGPYPRAPTPHRTECYNSPGGAGGGYMPAGTPTPGGPPLRVPPVQPTAPPSQQQERPTASMSAHNYGPPQAQTQQNRPQYSSYQYRTAQHGSRPATHPRQQQPYIPNATASNNPPVVYSVFPQAHLVHQTYPQPRTQAYFPYVPSYALNAYPNPMPSHTNPYFFPSGTQQIPTANLAASGPTTRGAGSLVGPQGASATPAASTAMQHPTQPPTHLHQNMSGMHSNPGKRVSHRIPIIDPKTNQDILKEINSNDSHHISGESSERQTPQPESLSVAEEFTRLVNEAANQPAASEIVVKSNFVPKNSDVPIVTSSPICAIQSPANVSNTTNNNVMKSDVMPAVNDTKNLAGEAAPEVGETPVVSAITDSPVIVPKTIPNIKQIQKSEHSLSLDTNKNLAANKYPKQTKTKPYVPENDEKPETAPIVSTTATSAISNPTTLPAPAVASSSPALTAIIEPQAATAPADSTSIPVATTITATISTTVSVSTTVPTSLPIETITLPLASTELSVPTADLTQASAPAPIPNPTSAPATASTPVSKPVTIPATIPVLTPTQTLILNLTPQPPRVKEPRERVRLEEKEKQKEKEPEVENTPNGPVPTVGINTTNNSQEIINLPTSQTCTAQELLSISRVTATNVHSENDNELTTIVECEKSKIIHATVKSTPTPTELLSASIEAAGVKSTKESLDKEESELELPELSVASQAQAKLNQSLASCNRNNLSKMKDINLNNKNTDLDTANGNITTETNDITTDNQEDNNKNNNQKPSVIIDKNITSIMASGEQSPKENEMIENGKNETDTISSVEQDSVALSDKESSETQAPLEKPVYVPKYKYNKDQWSPLNTSGKKCYDINFLKQVKDDPLSKNKPEGTQKMEALKVMRTTPQETSLQFASISKPINDSMMPNFMKTQVGTRNIMRDPKKDNKTLLPGKGSVKSSAPPNMGSGHKGLIHVSISLREDVKLNETENAWKPSRFKSDSSDQEQRKTEEVYKKFRGILNKLTPQKFDTLMERVKKLEIDTKTRLEGVIDLVFEKAIDEPNFSETYALMCSRLSTLKVPADNPKAPDQVVNFRLLIISKCQNQFVTNKVDEQVSKIEKELAECTDPAKKKELKLLLDEENRKLRMRSVGNVRFIGELYKLKMLTSKIMLYCMNYLIDKLEEEKLECLCKLLTTIGQQVEVETKEAVETIFKKMREIVDKRSHKISSRVRFMIQDVIELRRRNWVVKTIVDSQPKMMDQIQKEAEQQQRQIELMNSPMGGSFRRDEGGRGKRGGDNRRQGSNSFMENNWSSSRSKYTFDLSKFKNAGNSKDLQNVKLAPHQTSWNHGSGAKVTTQASNSLLSLTTTTNKFSVLDVNVPTDTIFRESQDPSLGYHSKGASIERSTFNSRGQVYGPNTGSRTGSMGAPRSSSGNRSMRSPGDSRSASPATTPRDPSPPIQEPEQVKNVNKVVKIIITDWQTEHDDKAMVDEIKKKFPSSQYVAVITDLLNITVEMSTKDAMQVSKALHHLLSCDLISSEAFISCLNEILELAPDLYIDIPMLYENLGYILSPLIEKKYITFNAILKLSESIISANQGHLLLKSLIKDMKSSDWRESGLELRQWMDDNHVAKFLEENMVEIVNDDTKVSEKVKNVPTPTETQNKLLHLMNNEESFECIRGWVQENVGEASNEDWFMRSLIQAICEYAFFGPESRNVLHFKKDRLRKYIELINEFGENRQAREANCLVGIQQLIHRLEHPQGLTVELFQYLHEQYIFFVDSFLSWSTSETEPEGKAVMLKALTSFFINMKEAENDDSCSED